MKTILEVATNISRFFRNTNRTFTIGLVSMNLVTFLCISLVLGNCVLNVEEPIISNFDSSVGTMLCRLLPLRSWA